MTYKKDLRMIRQILQRMDADALEDLIHSTNVVGTDPRARAQQIWHGRRKVAEYVPNAMRLSIYSLDIWHQAAVTEYRSRGL